MTNPYIKRVEEKNSITLDKAVENSTNSVLFPNFSYSNFIQGALLGAGAAYILTNEKAQQAIFKSVVRVGKLFEAGTEELKERFEDAKAEIEAEG